MTHRGYEKAILAGGCFWGVQELVRFRPGVVSTRVGYTGGDVPDATYRNHRGHAEALEITFDPAVTSYRELLEFFFQIHDPTTRNRQGNDVGTSYRSAVFYTDRRQKEIAEDTIADVDASGLWPGKVVTEVSPGVRSGRPSPSTRTICGATRRATRVTTCGRTGGCRGVPRRGDRTIGPVTTRRVRPRSPGGRRARATFGVARYRHRRAAVAIAPRASGATGRRPRGCRGPASRR